MVILGLVLSSVGAILNLIALVMVMHDNMNGGPICLVGLSLCIAGLLITLCAHI